VNVKSALFDVHLRVNVNMYACMNTSAHSTKNPTLGKPNTSENRTIGAVRRGFSLDRFDCIYTIVTFVLIWHYMFSFRCVESIALQYYSAQEIVLIYFRIKPITYNAYSVTDGQLCKLCLVSWTNERAYANWLGSAEFYSCILRWNDWRPLLVCKDGI